MSLKLMLLTKDVEYARAAEAAGVDRIFLDLEYLNKRERQRGRNTVISDHDFVDIQRIRSVLTSSDLLVRTNPVNPYLTEEVNRAIDLGEDVLMLPMAVDAEDAAAFVALVGGRARVVVMVYTCQALARLREIVGTRRVDEVFIGLNDLHIGLGLTFMFEIVSGGLVDHVASVCAKARMPFGFGGIARIGEGMLAAEYIIGEHYRLGSKAVILSRTFKKQLAASESGEAASRHLAREVERVRQREREVSGWGAEQFEDNRRVLIRQVKQIVRKLEGRETARAE